jgi:hypothetical protein
MSTGNSESEVLAQELESVGNKLLAPDSMNPSSSSGRTATTISFDRPSRSFLSFEGGHGRQTSQQLNLKEAPCSACSPLPEQATD